jgi:sugar-specific transcriptional regulator TrmB
MTIAQITEKLAEIGLTPNQITVYLELIKAKKCRANAIIKSAKLHRSIVYTCLDDLLTKGLVSKLTQNGVAIFEATSPKNLVEMMDAKRRTAETVADDLSKIMEQAPRDIRIFEGDEGVLKARERSLDLKSDETVYVLGVSQLTTTPAYESMWLPYHKKRISKGIKAKLFFDRTSSPEQVASRNAMSLTQAKRLPFDLPAWFEVYGQTFAVGVPAQDPVVFSMNSPEASAALKNFFEYLWNQNVLVETGRPALQKAVDSILDEVQGGQEYCVLGASFGKYNRKEMIDFYTSYHTKRIAKGVTINMLAFSESTDEIKNIFRTVGDPEGKISRIKTLDSATQNPMQVYLYNSKAMVVIMGENPTIMRFEQKEVYDNFKAYFDALWGQESYILKGPKALQEIFLETVDAKELRYIGARGYFMDQYPDLFKPVLEKIKATPGVSWKYIVDPSVRGHKITRFPWAQTKYTLSTVKNPNVVWLYGNKVVVISWAGNEPVMFVSTNPQLVQSYNDYFEELWGRA